MSFSKPLSLKKVLDDLEFSNVELVKLCYANTDEGGIHKCKLCGVKRSKGQGYTNLTSHIEQKHLAGVKDVILEHRKESRGPMFAHVRPLSQDAKDYFNWIEWVVMGDHPFSFVENKYTRANSRISSISRPTLMEYMEAVRLIIQLSHS